jgi:hypothetical protein
MGPWDIVKGVGLIAGGVVQWIGGVAAASTPTGVGQIGGTLLIMNGSTTIGFGVATLINNGKKDIPTGTAQAICRGIDQINKDESHTAEKVGSMVDFLAGLPSGPVNSALQMTSNAANVVNGVATVETISNLSSSSSSNSNNADANKSQKENKNTEDKKGSSNSNDNAKQEKPKNSKPFYLDFSNAAPKDETGRKF